MNEEQPEIPQPHENPENIQIGDTVWLKTDIEQIRPMQVKEIQRSWESIDITLGDIDETAPFEAICEWVDGSTEHERTFPLSELTKTPIRKRKWWKFWA